MISVAVVLLPPQPDAAQYRLRPYVPLRAHAHVCRSCCFRSSSRRLHPVNLPLRLLPFCSLSAHFSSGCCCHSFKWCSSSLSSYVMCAVPHEACAMQIGHTAAGSPVSSDAAAMPPPVRNSAPVVTNPGWRTRRHSPPPIHGPVGGPKCLRRCRLRGSRRCSCNSEDDAPRAAQRKPSCSRSSQRRRRSLEERSTADRRGRPRAASDWSPPWRRLRTESRQLAEKRADQLRRVS